MSSCAIPFFHNRTFPPIGSVSSPGVTDFLSHFPAQQRSIFTRKHSTAYGVIATALGQEPHPHQGGPGQQAPPTDLELAPCTPSWDPCLQQSCPSLPDSDHPWEPGPFPLLSFSPNHECQASLSPLPHRTASQSPPLLLMFTWGHPHASPKPLPCPGSAAAKHLGT